MELCVVRSNLTQPFQASHDFVGLERHHTTERYVGITHLLKPFHGVRVGFRTPTLRHAQRVELAAAALVFFEELRGEVNGDLLSSLPFRRSVRTIEFEVIPKDDVVDRNAVVEAKLLIEGKHIRDGVRRVFLLGVGEGPAVSHGLDFWIVQSEETADSHPVKSMLLCQGITTMLDHGHRHQDSVKRTLGELLVDVTIITMAKPQRGPLFRFKIEARIDLVLAIGKEKLHK